MGGSLKGSGGPCAPTALSVSLSSRSRDLELDLGSLWRPQSLRSHSRRSGSRAAPPSLLILLYLEYGSRCALPRCTTSHRTRLTLPPSIWCFFLSPSSYQMVCFPLVGVYLATVPLYHTSSPAHQMRTRTPTSRSPSLAALSIAWLSVASCLRTFFERTRAGTSTYRCGRSCGRGTWSDGRRQLQATHRLDPPEFSLEQPRHDQ